MIVFKTKDDIETWFHNNIKKTYEDIYRNQDSINEEHIVSSFYNGPVELSVKSKKKAS